MKIYKNPLSKGHPDQIKSWAKTLSELTFENCTDKKIDKLWVAAGDWNVCPCGNLCKSIPRHANSSKPMDMKLADLGSLFDEATTRMRSEFFFEKKTVFLKWLKTAREIHQKIEARAAIILAEQN